MHKLIEIIRKYFYSTLIVFVIFLSFLTFFSSKQLGEYRLYTIQSGSMEPELMIGDLILVQRQQEYFVGDVITVKKKVSNNAINNSNSTLTHRIEDFVDGTQKRIMTKGDANFDVDPGGFVHDDVVGKVIWSFPYLGKLIDYIKTDEGLGLLIIAPAAYIIFKELNNIRKEIRNAKLDTYKIE